MIVVADASPLRYLILIEQAHVLPALYGRVVVPAGVITELSQERTPTIVQTWLSNRPDWLHVVRPAHPLAPLREGLGPGEREAIALAAELAADVLLMDDREGRREAEQRNLLVVGTLRVLADASGHDLLDLRVALDRLRQTNFRASERLIQWLLEQDAARRAT